MRDLLAFYPDARGTIIDDVSMCAHVIMR